MTGALRHYTRGGPRLGSRQGTEGEPANELERDGRCVACGYTIQPSDEEVRVHGQRAHTRCTVYRTRHARRS